MGLRPKFRKEYVKVIERFLQDYLSKSGSEGIVVAMSGGLDSSVVAALAARSVGPERTAGLHLPDSGSSPTDERDSRELAESLGMTYNVIPIDDFIEPFSTLDGTDDRLKLGNIKARCRMTILYHASHSMNYLVAGTSNKSELLIGYFTKHGDGAADLLPIGDLYKTQVVSLAEEIGIQRSIIEKEPSAGLWPGQTDEEELGISYEDLDSILMGIEIGFDADEISERTGLDVQKVEETVNRVKESAHKRRLGLIPKLGISTIGVDWRE